MPPEVVASPLVPCVFDEQAVKRMTKEGSIILVFNQKVYDVTKFARYHPGGDHLIKVSAGTDVTDVMRAMHHHSILDTKLPRYCIGEYIEDPLLEHDPERRAMITRKIRLSQAYLQLEQKLIADGIYEPNHRFFILEGLKCLGFFLLSIALALWGPRHILNFVVSALCLTFMWQQGAFLVHDLAHRYVTYDRKLDYIVAVLFSNFCSGTCVGWWKHNHNIHHIVTNDPSHDPDIQHMPFFVYSTKFFNSLYSHYYGREMTFDEASKFLVSIQHYTFYFILMFARFNLYAQGFIHMATRPCPMPRLEMTCTLSFFIWYPALLYTFPDWWCRITFILLTHLPQAILHLQLLMSHTFMPIEEVDDQDLFVLRQLRTSVDIECPEWLDWFHGGLHFQVIHHLFPRVPRPHFRRLLVHVKAFCAEQGLIRHSVSFGGANRRLFTLLKEIAEQVQMLVKVARHAQNTKHHHHH